MIRIKPKCSGLTLLISFIILTCAVFTGAAEPREGNVDFFVVVDTSLSMENEIEEAKEYVMSRIFDGLLKDKDHLTLICFFAEAQVLFDRQLENIDSDLREASAKLEELRGKRHYTDIGNALDLLSETAAKHSGLGLPQYAVFITDGLHDPPPGSKYPGKGRGVVEHPLLNPHKETVHNSWRVWIIGPSLKDTRDSFLARAEKALPKTNE